MSPEASESIEKRAATILVVLMMYVGIYLDDKDKALALVADDKTLGALMPSDAQLAFFMFVDLITGVADVDSDDIRTLASVVLASLEGA